MKKKIMEIGGCSGSDSNKDGFIDRSRVRILLCDNNHLSSQHAFALLSQHCSYQVTCVKSARQVIDALNAEGPDIDIILSEVDLPMAKGMKMLKYIMRDNNLRRIPVIMMSAQDEVSIVVKCLRLGAADYLVKPLRTNELLNLWTHMWRRRRMLGLAEKNIMNYEFDLVASDPSDGNTNSTTPFSDDTDDKSRKSTNPEICIPARQECETNAPIATSMSFYATLEQPHLHLLDCRPDVPGICDRRTESFHAYKPPPLPRGRQLASFPKKSELRIGESSAFFTYVPKSTAPGIVYDVEIAKPYASTQDKPYTWAGQVRKDNRECENTEPRDDFPTKLDSHSKDNGSSIPTVLMEYPNKKVSNTDASFPSQLNPRKESQSELSNSHWQNAYPYYIPGLVNQGMMPQYPKNLPQCPPHIPNMPSFPYYPMGLCLQPGQLPTPHHQWPSYGTSSSATDPKLSKVDRREAALMKFRQKRKERCFDKKIRYVNRKRLAERRPRVRGQFVRKMNGIDVDLNGTPCSVDLDEEEEEDEEENAGMDSSPEYDA